LGCTPNWLSSEKKFKCPCHGSGFRETGLNFEGPAPRPLERYALSLDESGNIRIDKSRKIRDVQQWNDPDFLLKV
jgi:cytochrome b6-f complex iron-sulfur subunit